jgi:ectoine hydroxylase-related dioxygenase (phytanoyl-CoA dioxygenase family)
LLLFPGWLEHGVATNETTSDRVSISFNINFKTA